MTKNESNKPVRTFRYRALSVAVFAREHEGKTYYNFVPQRAYTEDDGKTWSYSTSFDGLDALVIAQLLEMAFAWAVAQAGKESAK